MGNGWNGEGHLIALMNHNKGGFLPPFCSGPCLSRDCLGPRDSDMTANGIAWGHWGTIRL
eukprot:maker-scaffold1192_size56221-snap-gene-0.7 protein:Tk00516 transcript:maker-scaffold1192_size56221-snap-gene-0.7-mRNA-1 annotation:"---NA---"